jgi:ABC-type Zn uptake system ZnuABC Zn-binding protein ZnuA
MKKNILSISLILLLSIGLFGCSQSSSNSSAASSQPQSDKDKAMTVVKSFEDTQSNITYKDPSSFQKGDQYLAPDLAKAYNQHRAPILKFTKDMSVTFSGSPATITFVKQDGSNYIFEEKAERNVYSDKTNSSLGKTVIDFDVTVTKGAKGDYLISSLQDHKVK